MSKLLDFVIDLKIEYTKKFGIVSYEHAVDESCIIRWAIELKDKRYIDVLKNIKVSQEYNYVVFKPEPLFAILENITYNEFWDMYDGIYRECCGAVIDIANDCFVLRPFEKFFDINERDETSENQLRRMLQTAKCVQFADKLDGSIISSRWYDSRIVLSSSGILKRNSIIEDSYKIISNNENYYDLIQWYSDYTCMFEYISPDDKHIVDYSTDMYGLHLIGMRHVRSGELIPYSDVVAIAKRCGIKTTEYYNVGFDDILSARDKYKANEKEGYVMYLDGMLVKIKCSDYIQFHKTWKAGRSINGLLEVVYKDL